MYFGMSVSAPYLEATVTAAAVARARGDLEVFVNMSQMTVSQMSLTETTDSTQQRQHWLAEQALNWSGLPVVHVRPTAFLQHFFFLAWAAESIARDGTIRLPFGTGRTSPVDVRDVAEVIATFLASPAGHVGKIYELTGPKSQDMHGLAAEYSEALGRPVTYVDVPFEQWRDQELRTRGLPEYVAEHLLTMVSMAQCGRRRSGRTPGRGDAWEEPRGARRRPGLRRRGPGSRCGRGRRPGWPGCRSSGGSRRRAGGG